MKRGPAFLIAMAFASTFAVIGSSSAAHCGEGGSPKNASGSCETVDNQVRCGEGTDTGVAIISAGASGAEVCTEGSKLPVDGRIGAQQDCRCVYIDGDNTNRRDLMLNGWARVDQDGLHCAERNKPNNQSYNSAPGTDPAGCVL